MFIQSPILTREMNVMLRGIKMKLGSIPPHWELYAGINPVRFKMFMEEINYLSNHPTIDPAFFTFERFFIATQHGFGYCRRFNRDYLLKLDFAAEEIAAVADDPEKIPLDNRHKTLFVTAIRAMDDPQSFTAQSIETLHTLGWSDADIFDAIDHAAFLFKFHKILEAYLET
jgi:hypothetical protein